MNLHWILKKTQLKTKMPTNTTNTHLKTNNRKATANTVKKTTGVFPEDSSAEHGRVNLFFLLITYGRLAWQHF